MAKLLASVPRLPQRVGTRRIGALQSQLIKSRVMRSTTLLREHAWREGPYMKQNGTRSRTACIGQILVLSVSIGVALWSCGCGASASTPMRQLTSIAIIAGERCYLINECNGDVTTTIPSAFVGDGATFATPMQNHRIASLF
jgi:hypothetical protein